MTKPKSTKRPPFIWRIEDERGLGPYNGSIGTEAFRSRKTNPPPHLDPVKGEPWATLVDYVPVTYDRWGEARPPSELRFGFSYAKQLKAWFGDPKTIKAERWEDHGAHISVYKLDDRPIVESARQTMFYAVAPKLPEVELPLSDLWTETPAQMEREAEAKLSDPSTTRT